ncbi:hypothetical protein D1872_307570 [compost metagenome]
MFSAAFVTYVNGSPLEAPLPPVVPGVIRLGKRKPSVSSDSPLSVKSTSMIVAKALSFISKADQQPLMITRGKSAKHIVISLFLNLFIPAHLFAATNVANCFFV